MAGSPRNFDVEDFNKWKRRQGSSYRIPPRANFMAAANYIRNFFESKRLNWAAMMGLAMACLGSRREMLDIHVVYDDRDLNRIKMKLEVDPRVRLQKGINSLFPAKLLVATGPKFKDVGCTEDVEVEVDLVPPGAYGTPPNDVLKDNQVMLRLKQEGSSETFKGLNMLYLVKTTIAYCKSQDLAWDPKKDLLFLCQFYGREIELIRNQLNARQIQENFLGAPFVLRLPADEQRRCYHVLLGADKNPPPSMSLTPAPPIGHRLTASTSDINSARPRITSHKSSPSLNTMQQSSQFLTPPLPGRPKKDKSSPQSAPPTTASAPVVQAPVAAPDPTSQRDSRSRYRQSSAPSSPHDIQGMSYTANPHNAPRTRSAERPSHPLEAPVDRTKPIGSQRHHQLPDPVLKSGHVATQVPSLPIGMRPQKSMPTLAGRTVGPVPIFAHGQNTVASQVPKSSAPQNVPQGSSVSNFTSHAPQGHGQRYEGLQSQNRDVPKASDARKLPPAVAQPHLPRLPDISQSRLTADIGATSSRNAPDHQSGNSCTTVSDGRAQRHINLSVPKPSHQSQSQSQSQLQQPALPRLSQQQRETARAFVHELDASPHNHTITPQFEPPNSFIAELPADTGSHHSEEEVSPLIRIGIGAESERTNMNTVYPGQTDTTERALPHAPPQIIGQLPPSPLQTSKQARVLPSHTSSSISDSLPSSLMIGHGRIAPTKSGSQPIPYSGSQPINVNSQKYIVPQYSNPTVIPSSVKKPTASHYKAYSGPISPPVQASELVHPGQQPASRSDIHMFPVQSHTEARPSYVHDVHRPHLQPVNGAYQAIPPVGNLPTPPAFESEDSKQLPRRGYGWNNAAAISARNASPADESRFARHDLSTNYAPNGHRENPAQVVAFQQSGPFLPSHYSPPATLSVVAHRESGLVQMPRSTAEPGHQRSTSRDSQTSTSSHDSEKLAQEYQSYLPDLRSRFADEEVDFT